MYGLASAASHLWISTQDFTALPPFRFSTMDRAAFYPDAGEDTGKSYAD
jgi:hypothetical protein